MGGICGNLRNLREEKLKSRLYLPQITLIAADAGGICGNLRNLREEHQHKGIPVPAIRIPVRLRIAN
jgi:hypothetical protein